MAFPRNSEGQLDIEAYVNLLAVNPEAAQLMENELVNEDPDTINYFYDNVQRVIEEFRIRNNEELTRLDARRQELGAQKRVYVAAYEKTMQDTLADARTKEGRLLTSSEKKALNGELAQGEINLLQQPSVPQKTQAQLEKERKKAIELKNREEFLAAVAETKRLQALHPEHVSHINKDQSSNKTQKNRGCTIF